MKNFPLMVWFLLLVVPAKSYSQYRSSAPVYVPPPYVAPVPAPQANVVSAPRPIASANGDSISRASGAPKRGGGIDGAMAELMSGDGNGTSTVDKSQVRPDFIDQAGVVAKQNLETEQSRFDANMARIRANQDENNSKERAAVAKLKSNFAQQLANAKSVAAGRTAEEQAIIDRTKGNQAPDWVAKEAERKAMNARYERDIAASKDAFSSTPIRTAEEQAIIDRTKGNQAPDWVAKEAEREKMNFDFEMEMANAKAKQQALKQQNPRPAQWDKPAN